MYQIIEQITKCKVRNFFFYNPQIYLIQKFYPLLDENRIARCEHTKNL